VVNTIIQRSTRKYIVFLYAMQWVVTFATLHFICSIRASCPSSQRLHLEHMRTPKCITYLHLYCS